MTEDGATYPEGLTPGERRVLDYVRKGTLDAEISVRLGLPVGEVKERIARILAKQGLRERSQLLAVPVAPEEGGGERAAFLWARPGTAVIDFSRDPGDVEEPEGTDDDGPVIDFAAADGASRAGRRTLARWVTGALVLATLGGLVLWAPWSNDSHAPSATPTMGASPGEAATAGPVVANAIIPIDTVRAANLERRTVLYVETGCAQCDGPPETITRIWTRLDGTFAVDKLFSVPGGIDGQRAITGIAASPGGHPERS